VGHNCVIGKLNKCEPKAGSSFVYKPILRTDENAVINLFCADAKHYTRDGRFLVDDRHFLSARNVKKATIGRLFLRVKIDMLMQQAKLMDLPMKHHPQH